MTTSGRTATSTLLTGDGVAQLRERLRVLREVTMPSYRPLLIEAERDERVVAEFERLQAEADRLESLIAGSVIIDESDIPADGKVRLGSRILVELPDGQEWIRIVDAAEAFLDDERISQDSPLAKALLGAVIGDVVEVSAPRGVWSARVVEVAGIPKPRARRRK